MQNEEKDKAMGPGAVQDVPGQVALRAEDWAWYRRRKEHLRWEGQQEGSQGSQHSEGSRQVRRGGSAPWAVARKQLAAGFSRWAEGPSVEPAESLRGRKSSHLQAAVSLDSGGHPSRQIGTLCPPTTPP